MSDVMYCQLAHQCGIWHKQDGKWNSYTCMFRKNDCHSTLDAGRIRNTGCPFSREKVYGLLVDNFTENPADV